MTASCVIYNPAAGKGRARQQLTRLQRRFRDHDFALTTAPGAAVALARQAAQAGYARVIAAGGDGTVHEVANGVLAAERPDVTFGVWPIGSANDYAFALGLPPRWPDAGSVTRRQVDVGRVTAGTRQRFFVNGLGLGFNGAVTLESRRIRRLQGMALYGWAMLRALVYHFDQPELHLTIDAETRLRRTLTLSVNLGPREGGFCILPQASLTDGRFDFLQAGPLRRWELAWHLPGLILGRVPTNHPQLWLGQGRHLRVTAERPVRIHTDGEFFAHLEDGVQSVQVDVEPARLWAESGTVP